jgi:hypothetical protein
MDDLVFYRLDPDAIGPPGATSAAIWMPISALVNSELAASYGFEHFGRRDPKQPVPRALFAADMHSDRKVLFFLAGPEGPGEEPILVLEAVFPDPHPRVWSDLAHQQRRILLLAGEIPFTAAPTIQALKVSSWIAWAPLVVRLYPEGIGTSLPPRDS